MREQVVTLTPAQIEAIAAEASKKAVRETLLTLGIDISKPESVIRAQEDFQFLRAWREAKGKFVGGGILAFAGLFISGIAGLIWAAVRNN